MSNGTLTTILMAPITPSWRGEKSWPKKKEKVIIDAQRIAAIAMIKAACLEVNGSMLIDLLF